ncbi:MAG TPA: PspC domain-containing protein [Candidatus Pacearchaeota archaeon]|nr:PspC domain-containing protein [Candidatus Pacearchaeota archaeon]
MAKNIKKLHRSSKDKIFFGVCGGLAEYLEVDSLVMRIIFLFLIFMGGSGIIIYLILALLMPDDTTQLKSNNKIEKIEDNRKEEDKNEKININISEDFDNHKVLSFSNIMGILFVLVGLNFLFRELFQTTLFYWLNWQIILAVILIFIGIKIINNTNKQF